jgi:hypothetical protein
MGAGGGRGRGDRIVAAAVPVLRGESAPPPAGPHTSPAAPTDTRGVATRYLQAWARGDATAAAALTDHRRRRPRSRRCAPASVRPRSGPRCCRSRPVRSHPGGVDARPGPRDWWASRTPRRPFSQGEAQARTRTTTLSSSAQAAAQAAIDGASSPAMLIAIQPSTGDILAVAQNAGRQHAERPQRALRPRLDLQDRHRRGGTGKGSGQRRHRAPCPSTAQVGRRTIPNDDRFSCPRLPLHSAFARSCNTTFAPSAGLPADALAVAASQFGLNADFTIPGITTEAGKVVAASDAAGRSNPQSGGAPCRPTRSASR